MVSDATRIALTVRYFINFSSPCPGYSGALSALPLMLSCHKSSCCTALVDLKTALRKSLSGLLDPRGTIMNRPVTATATVICHCLPPSLIDKARQVNMGENAFAKFTFVLIFYHEELYIDSNKPHALKLSVEEHIPPSLLDPKQCLRLHTRLTSCLFAPTIHKRMSNFFAQDEDVTFFLPAVSLPSSTHFPDARSTKATVFGVHFSSTTANPTRVVTSERNFSTVMYLEWVRQEEGKMRNKWPLLASR